MARIGISLALIALTSLALNFFAGIDGRCSDRGWSGCGWIWQLTGWLVLICVAGLVGLVVFALIRRVRARGLRAS